MIERGDCLNTRTVPLHWCHCLINGSIFEWQFLDSIYSFAYPQGVVATLGSRNIFHFSHSFFKVNQIVASDPFELSTELRLAGVFCSGSTCDQSRKNFLQVVTGWGLTHTLLPRSFISLEHFTSKWLGTLYFKVAWYTLLPNSLCSSTHSTPWYTLLLITFYSSAHFAPRNTFLLSTLCFMEHFAS